MASFIVVDDSMFFRLQLSQMLKSLGHTVLSEATDGAQAAIQYSQLKPDMVTMDISMPKTDGITGVKKILEIDPNAKIIMVSAMGQRDVVLEAIKLGAKHFVLKPIDKEIMSRTINKVIDNKELARIIKKYDK